MLLNSGETWTVASYDRTYLGQIDQSDVEELLGSWVKPKDGLAVVSGHADSPDQGWLTISNGSHFVIGNSSTEESGHLVIALKASERGEVTVSGTNSGTDEPSTLNVAGDIDVGEYGNGQVHADGGAQSLPITVISAIIPVPAAPDFAGIEYHLASIEQFSSGPSRHGLADPQPGGQIGGRSRK